jgi:hypothetical protein
MPQFVINWKVFYHYHQKPDSTIPWSGEWCCKACCYECDLASKVAEEIKTHVAGDGEVKVVVKTDGLEGGDGKALATRYPKGFLSVEVANASELKLSNSMVLIKNFAYALGMYTNVK